MKKLNAYVVKADGKQIRVNTLNNSLDSNLKMLGFDFDCESLLYVKESNNTKEKASQFSASRDLGICFSDGKEWCPSELFEYFRDLGLISGEFNRVSWINPTTYKITVV